MEKPVQLDFLQLRECDVQSSGSWFWVRIRPCSRSLVSNFVLFFLYASFRTVTPKQYEYHTDFEVVSCQCRYIKATKIHQAGTLTSHLVFGTQYLDLAQYGIKLGSSQCKIENRVSWFTDCLKHYFSFTFTWRATLSVYTLLLSYSFSIQL